MKRFFASLLALLLVLALCVPAAAAALPPEEDVFYQQLSEAGKAAFLDLNTDENLALLSSGQALEVEFTGTYNEETFNAELEEKEQPYIDAFIMLLQMHPEFFWNKGYSQNLTGSIGGGSYSLTLTLNCNFRKDWGEAGTRSIAEDAATVRTAVLALAAEARKESTPYSQLLYVHDWLTTHNIYNSAAADAEKPDYYSEGYLPWTPLASLTDLSQPVCEGYARAFKMVCDELGYPCIYVCGNAGGAHAWNMVQAAGKWYAVDVTFDDPVVSGIDTLISEYEDQSHFLVGSNTEVDDTATFSQTHIPDSYILGVVPFTYPALSDYALDPDASWSMDDPDHPAKITGAVTSTENGTAAEISIYCNSDQTKAVAYGARYSAAGQFLGVEPIQLTPGDDTKATILFGDGSYIRVFVLNGETSSPLCAAEELRLTA